MSRLRGLGLQGSAGGLQQFGVRRSDSVDTDSPNRAGRVLDELFSRAYKCNRQGLCAERVRGLLLGRCFKWGHDRLIAKMSVSVVDGSPCWIMWCDSGARFGSMGPSSRLVVSGLPAILRGLQDRH